MKRFNQLHKSIKIRLYLQFFTIVASTTIMPYIAVYFSGLVGAKTTGILVILVICSGIIGGLFGGYWSDLIGRKKLLVFAELGLGISFLAIAFFNSPWVIMPYVSFGLFLVNMFCNGVYIPVSTSMIYDLVKKQERNFVFTAVYWIANLATAFGTITGAFLFEDYHFFLFIFVAAITLTSSLITYFYIGETLEKHKTAAEQAETLSMLSNYKKVLKDHTFMIFLLATLCVSSLENHLTNYIAIHLEKNVEETSVFGLFSIDGINMIGILHAENTLVIVLAVGLVSWLVRKTSDYRRLTLGMGLFVVCYSLLSYTASPWLLIGLMVFISIGELMYAPVRQSLLAELADDSYRSSYLALNSFMGQGATIIAGATITLGGVFPAYVISGGIFVMGMSGVWMMAYVTKKVQRVPHTLQQQPSKHIP